MKKIALSLLTFLMLVACSSESSETNQNKGNVALQIELGYKGQTRSVIESKSLPDNSTYGVFATTTDSPVKVGLVENGDNRCVTYASGNSTFDSPVYIPEYKNVFVWAYYPYNESFRAEEIMEQGMPVNIETQTDYLLGRSDGGASESSPKVPVIMRHALARIHVNVYRSEYNYRDYTFNSLEFSNVYAKGFVKFNNNVVYDEKALISLSMVPKNTTLDENNQLCEVDLLVIPTKGQDIQLQLHGTLEKKVSLPSYSYDAGEQYNIDVVINHEEQLQVGSWYITQWQDLEQSGLEIWADDVTE